MTFVSYFHDKPIFRVMIESNDITQLLNDRLIDLTLTENRTDQADQLDITISDHDNRLAMPTRQAKIKLAIGWSQTGLIEKGDYYVDEVEHSGSPDKITIRARSAQFGDKLRTRTERSFHDKTIGDIVKTIAQANKLKAVVSDTLAKKKIQHIDQTNESDLAFLNRLGKRYDTVATVKEDNLLFIPIKGGQKANGEKMPQLDILRRNGDNHSYSEISRDSYTGVVAYWQDPKKAQKRKVIVGVKGNAKHLKETYGNEESALEAARSEWQRIRRGQCTMRFSCAYGIPILTPQFTIKFPDMKKPISDYTWLIKSVTHKLSTSGFTTDLDLELEDTPDEDKKNDDVQVE